MCHFVYLLKAIDVGFIDKDKVSIDIIKAKEGPANNEYFKLVNSKCEELGIEVKKKINLILNLNQILILAIRK